MPTARYKTKEGARVPSVTQVLGRFKESGGLMHWAYKQGMRAERGEIDSLYDDRDKAAESGTLAHEMVERYIRGEDYRTVLANIDDSKIRDEANAAFEAYLTWEDNFHIGIDQTEVQLVSEQYGYGGTLDALGRMNGRHTLLDWKTSKGVYRDYVVQCAAYAILVQECLHIPITDCHILRFSKGGSGDFSHHYFGDIEDAKDMWLHLLQAYKYDLRLKERI